MATPAQPDTKNLSGATEDASAGGLFQSGGSSHLSTVQQQIAIDVASAEAAKVAAQAAQTAAETAETNAETAQTGAETAKTAAETAKTAAETAKTAAETAETNAETAETNAATSETNAATSATNAANSEQAAETAETNAQTSATNAATSATNAATSATTASTKATEASTSATTASTKATEASNSATQAATSATNASTSETNASNSATAASNSATTASTKASEASTSATTATTKASEAATSATNAATSATTATTKASEASTSATNAATSETNAATSATAASASQTAAANSANALAVALDSFDDKYLGKMADTDTASSASTTATWSNGGSTLTVASATGIEVGQNVSATGIPSDANVLSIDGTSVVISHTATAAGSSAAVTFTGYGIYGAFSSSKDGPATDNDNGTLTEGMLYFNTTDNEMRVYDGSNWIAASSAGQVSLSKYFYTATAGQTTFSGADDDSNTLAYTVGNELVMLNGVILEKGTDYTASNGSSIVLTTAAVLNDELNVIVFKSFTTADMVSATDGGTFQSSVTFSNGLVANGLTYPTTDGTANQVIKTDGSGTLSFFTPDYYGDSDVDAHLSGGTGVTYTTGTIAIGQDVGTTADVTFGTVESDLFGSVQFQAKNTEGSTITKGTPVYIKGHSGNNAEIGIADANDPAKMPAFGIAAEDITDTSVGDVLNYGDFSGFDTSSYSVSDELFVSNTGTLTATRPTGTDDAVQKIAKVVRSHASVGQLFVMGAGRSNDIPNSTTRSIQFKDNAKATFGTSDDLQVYHDGTNSYVKDSGTGELRVSSNGTGVHISNEDATETLAKFTVDGSNELYYDNSKKLETSSTGVTITGEVNATSIASATTATTQTSGTKNTTIATTSFADTAANNAAVALAIALG